MKRNMYLLISLMTALMILISACTPAPAPETAVPATAAPGEPVAAAPAFEAAPTTSKTIVFIPKSTDVTYWLALKKGVEDQTAKLGLESDYQGVAKEADIAQQVDLVKNIVSSKPYGIVMAATDAKALAPAVADAIKAGVPVVTVDSGVDPDESLAYFATDNVAGGASGAEWLCKAVGGKGKVGDLGILPGAQSGIEREKGFADWMKANCPGVTVVPVQYTGCDATKALNAATDILTANPDLVGFFGACAANGLGAAQAAKAAGKDKEIQIVSFDPNPEIIPLFKAGSIGALIAQDPYTMGVMGVDAIVAAVNGQPIPEKKILIPVVVITAENAKDYPQFLE